MEHWDLPLTIADETEWWQFFYDLLRDQHGFAERYSWDRLYESIMTTLRYWSLSRLRLLRALIAALPYPALSLPMQHLVSAGIEWRLARGFQCPD
jgi:hypothetical protein